MKRFAYIILLIAFFSCGKDNGEDPPAQHYAGSYNEELPVAIFTSSLSASGRRNLGA